MDDRQCPFPDDEPFVGLQTLVVPYKLLLDNTPATLQDAVCGHDGSDFCKWMIP
ncbi:MAG TPA: hypothetical protein VF355_02225 [Anaerolineaceae bacterium]